VPEHLPDLDELLTSWLLTLRAQRKSPSTIKVYRSGVTSFLNFCEAQGLSRALTKLHVIEYMASLADGEPATGRARLSALKLFARWLADEEGFDADPILAVRPPKLDDRAVASLSDAEVRRLVKACEGAALRDKRDKAMVVLFAETGLRAAELLALDVADVDLISCVLHVRRGKGGKGRRVKFSAACAAILDRYARARRTAGNPADSGPLWVGPRGALSYTGMSHTLKARAAAAGVHGFHVHRLRHTAAVRWLKSGGSETGLMAQSGWKSRVMVDRYAKSSAEELAAEEFDRLDLGLGDL
jgi:integrase/recombinase XerD